MAPFWVKTLVGVGLGLTSGGSLSGLSEEPVLGLGNEWE
jgi:hypothetical protein